ncbi:dipeptide ABC transporter ATP-binding protein [Microbacterium hydrocarbonoxydans]|uniref:Peptide/nickel transport system ATP-binding protein n=1 Tax=Microbacterium hydrocarbonoxydans TaxID=273678 RepID=A0A1H4L685_9MICO|nr:ABC transporter ATP-binding protein [Microbacterium hydrocarbonoxydans]SEB66244.1 peptide/nickel transport system ATP-binding protein [Microbacterium hydrocarbonoxydans]
MNTTMGLKVSDLRIVGGPEIGDRLIVDDAELEVAPGESVAIVGESGSGKSMTVKALVGLLPRGIRAEGSAVFEGTELLSLTERGWRNVRGQRVGMIMQNPFTMLNPVFRCGRIIEESLRPDERRRMSRAERRAEVARRLAEVGIFDESVADRYPFQLSGGMRQRVAIAAALAREPDLLIADEPSTALDVTTQREILALIKRLQVTRGMGLILITHDLRIAFSMCDRVKVMYAGVVVEASSAASLEAEPLHPYTQGLLLSEPPADRRVAELVAIPGSVPAAADVAHVCPFSTRCAWVTDDCRARRPALRTVEAGRETRCVRIEEIRGEMREVRAAAESEAVAVVPRTFEAPLVRVSEARKEFRSGREPVVALDSVSIELGAGEGVGLVGESGSGKTTLGRAVAGLEPLSSGTVEIGGVDASDWARLSRRDRMRLRGTVQMIFQDAYSSLNPTRTIGSTLAEAVSIHDPSARDMTGRVRELLHSVGLDEAYAQRKPAALSGGQHQRVAIARALAVRPQLLICDEPVAALDVSVQAQVLNLFSRIRDEQGIGYLFITHDLSIVRQVVDRLYVMRRGAVVESGDVEAVLGAPRHPYTKTLMESVPRPSATWLDAALSS